MAEEEGENFYIAGKYYMLLFNDVVKYRVQQIIGL
jgi:hypothetical protein